MFFQLKSNTKAATRRLAAGKSVTVTATIAVPDAVAASKASAGIAKVKPAAFIRTLKKELVKEESFDDVSGKLQQLLFKSGQSKIIKALKGLNFKGRLQQIQY